MFNIPNILQTFVNEDDEYVQDIVYKEYGYLFKITCLYPDLVTYKQKCLTMALLSLYTILISIAITLLLTTVALSTNDLMQAVVTFHYFTLPFAALFWMGSLFCLRKQLSNIFKAIHVGVYKYDDEMEITRRNMKESWKGMQNVMTKVLPLYLEVVVTPALLFLNPLMNLVTGKEGDRIYTENGVSLNLPIPSWIPFGTDTSVKVFFAVLIEVLYVPLLMLISAAAMALVLECTHAVYMELNYLNKSIELLPERTLRLYRKLYGKSLMDLRNIREDELLSECTKICLKENALHHQRIIRLFQDASDVISTPIFVGYCIGSINVALVGSAFIFGTKDSAGIYVTTSMILAEIFVMLVIAWSGELISQASDDLRFALYSTQWMNFRKDTVIYIQVMATMAQRLLVPVFGKLLPLNINTFSAVMNSGYSYFNLIYANTAG